ncbi:hypothetical protein CLTEP_23410 [Clostridium tepidiprofundi DSM 19306]|uniref:Uncharacterized protein n=1 Tax=Clostridium tepidiprofundi DSM 19306 TaxID=1121338 RepID=A0A151AVL0_9CLOT|nr:hypothetical protein [Clostridium tepidiprofundi]KYH31678.1 hypothetical protein CLTEP_23410 [Clostridium tepidiprofundi DSM 19306]
MGFKGDNCKKCPEFLNGNCDGNDEKCMCRRCPRNLSECLVTRYCRETESPLEITLSDYR